MPRVPGAAERSRILVRIPNWIGDAVFSIPALEALGRVGDLTLLGLPGLTALLSTVPGVRGRVEVPAGGSRAARFRLARNLRRERFDLGVILPGSFSSAFEVFLAGARERVGRGGEGRGWLLTRSVPYASLPRSRHIVEEYLELAASAGGSVATGDPALVVEGASAVSAAVLLPHGDAPWLGLVPGGSYGPSKRWPAERFAELAGRFEDFRSVVFGSAEDRALAESIASRAGRGVRVLAGETPVPVLAACLARCRLVVGNDTGPTHLASAVGAPTVAIYGSTDPTWTGVRGPRARRVRRAPPCAPCFRRRCDRDEACLREISVDEVWEACQDLLSSCPPGTQGGREAAR